MKLQLCIPISTHARIYHFQARASSATTASTRPQALVKIPVLTRSGPAPDTFALKRTAGSAVNESCFHVFA